VSGDHHTHEAAEPRWLTAALGLIVAYMCGEVIAGIAAHSLALISDAGHMLTDAVALALVLITMRLAARPPHGGYTFGLKRAEILSAQANGITLVLLGVWLIYEAINRLIRPPTVHGGIVLGIALTGICVNLLATLMIARAGGRENLNVSGAFAHILTDVYAFAATAVAGIIVLAWGFNRADAIATLVVVALMLRAGIGLLRDSGRIFLEAAPSGLAPAAIGADMAGRPHVSEVHDLHIWEITSGSPAASAHVLVAHGEDCHAVRADLECVLAQRYGITHTTLQVDHEKTANIHCDDSHGPSYRH
jgi:cobalt-zinc-cadmium efflux system protein